jgi:hypothetical protein
MLHKPGHPGRVSRNRLPAALTSLLLAAGAPAYAQGGPPMVTDDPGTPGDGHWEINLASIGSRAGGNWLIAAPDADINYGWGERIQIKLDTPWNLRDDHGFRASGFGTSLFGVKWRFLDDESSGWTISTYPQIGFNFDSGAVARGLADPGNSLFLPLESAGHVGPVEWNVELGRNLQTQAPDQWIGGLVLAHSFGADLETMIELRRVAGGADSSTLLNLGLRRELAKGWTLLAALGHETAGASAERIQLLYYLGIQLQR